VLNILYVGRGHGTSGHRAETLRRLGHQVQLIDPLDFQPQGRFVSRVLGKLVREMGGLPLEAYVRPRLLNAVKSRSYDLVWVNGGELLGARTVALLHQVSPKVVNYNNDDPFGTRDRRRWMLYKEAVPQYELVVVVREVNIGEAYAAGARRVLRVFISADEVANAPLALTEREKAAWASDVVFAGAWMPERGPFLSKLLKLGVPLTIYGSDWHKAAERSVLKPVWASPGVLGLEDYLKALQCAKVCLGLLSKGNRDHHTRRSIEIPYIGSVLCAERTAEHVAMYKEGVEAVFWSTPEECATRCHELLSDPRRRQEIAVNGRRRCLANGHLNERVMSRIVEEAMK
jgi:spore maturation protein CgeB